MKLTNTAVRAAKPGKKTRRLFDGKGSYVEVAPKGGKWWRFKYRFAGKEKRLSLGVYPDVSLKQARERREECRRLVAEGIDPSRHRQVLSLEQVERSANSFQPVAVEWFTNHLR
ncbi:DUF4102 domain-containing protein [bacterium]|nr:DUF4102 domain-containing protein [candidate division CSSED10-310 bacterium]